MSLDDMIISYVNNPSDKLEKDINEKLEKVSSISIFNTLNNINEVAKTDEKNKVKYMEISKKILEFVKTKDSVNYEVDEFGRLKVAQKK